MTKAQASSRLTAVLIRMTDLYGSRGILPGHGAEYESLQAEAKELEDFMAS